ncbi:protein translocase subunit SecD [Geodermatophilus ruber]|uniref:Multifunctional fusion protein n=1 Tax=Geodermatophilus ruber TaxID=504800 RepID=A0A1I4L7U3_9ACTN|nr:protein translocase subunit SecD [Geodermatophilus ruber]SFL86873.1 protein translocase subunit secF /protein translocase subunit secD [Geodermatophilus ruber]
MNSPSRRTEKASPARSRPLLVRALLSLAVLVAATVAVLTATPTLGLDLRGGTQIVLEAQDSPTVTADAEATDRALEVLRRRVDALGVAEPTLVRSGERRIVVELPGLTEPREAVEVIGRTAQLTFHPVLGIAAPGEEQPATEGVDPAAETVLPDEDGVPVRLGPAALTGEGVQEAGSGIDLQGAGGRFVTVDFTGPGQTAWEQLTGQAACAQPGDPARRVAIVLDDEVISSPQVNPGTACGVGITGGTTQITGSFSQEEADNLAALVQGGALPVPVEVIEQRTVGPTLGDAAIDASVQAVLLGIVATAIFIVAVYRLMGLLAVVALVCYALIAYAALLTLGATLTLPGLAGFVLAVGMAVDANVLVYERSREEFAERGRSLRSAVTTGFRRALSAIADSNVTTLLAAGLLFFLASGPVRGFGVTLTVGVLASMFSALVITRTLAELAATRPALAHRPRLTGLHTLGRVRTWLTARQWRLYRQPRRWLAVSLLVVVLAAAGLAIRGLELGVEFTGGRSIQYATSSPLDPDAAREAVSAAGFPGAVVQEAEDGDVRVRTGPIDDAEQETVRDALAAAAGGAEVVSDELIGPTLGDELRRNALIALGVALLAQLGYLAVRFRWTYSAGAVAALIANVAVVVGVFAWTGRAADGVFLAAVLTVIGYSVNDSVVVFDRIRETRGGRQGQPFPIVAGDAVLQTLPRTVNTGASTLLVLTALLVLGGDSLGDFALALVLGIVAGTISTVSVAVPLTVALDRRWPPPPPGAPTATARRGAPVRRDDGAVV